MKGSNFQRLPATPRFSCKTALLFRNLASPFLRSPRGTHCATLRMDLLCFPKKTAENFKNSIKFPCPRSAPDFQNYFSQKTFEDKILCGSGAEPQFLNQIGRKLNGDLLVNSFHSSKSNENFFPGEFTYFFSIFISFLLIFPILRRCFG